MPLRKRLDPRFRRKGNAELINVIKYSKGGFLFGIGEKKITKCVNCGKKAYGGIYVQDKSTKKLVKFCNKDCRSEFENAE